MIEGPDGRERGAAAPRRANSTSPEHAARPKAELDEQERELALATEHPRGTERRRLLPYRDALNDAAVYARLPEADRDVIVRWAEVRRRIIDRGVDHDPKNLADPLLPAARLRAHVLEGERIAAGTGPDHERADPARRRAGAAVTDDGGDLIALVARIRCGAT